MSPTFDPDAPEPKREPRALLYEKVDPTFRVDLANSHPAVIAVGEWLLRIRGWEYRAKKPIADGHPDNDLWVRMPDPPGGGPLRWQLWQVKQRPGMHFTSHETYVDKWGNPYRTAFVGNRLDYETAGRLPPDWIAVVNATRTGALVVSGKTRAKWTLSKGVYCPTRGRCKDIYECPIELMIYRELVA